MPFHRPLGERESKTEVPNFIRPLSDKRAVVGERVILECQVSGHPDPMVKWLKDGHNVSNCPDYQIEEEGFKHRLIIDQVQGADSGRFTAQALNSAGSKQSTCILIVAPAPTPVPGAKPIYSPAPPQTPVGPSAPIFLKELRHQPLKPGEKMVMEARVAGQPLPTIEWLKNRKPLQNYRAKLEHDQTSGIVSMTLEQMFTDDVGEYTVKAVNQHGEAYSTAQLLPREQYERWFSDEQSKLTRDRKQNMLAQAGRPTSAVQRQMAKYGYGGALSDTESYGDLTWPASESETEPELAALEARGGGTRPILRTPLRGLRLTEGTDAILQANIVGNPKPKISWMKNGQPLFISGPRMQVTYKGTMAVLKISMVVPEDSGDYLVLAENRLGKVDSSARIEVYPLSVPDERPLLTPQQTPQQRAQDQQLREQHLREQQLREQREQQLREQQLREQQLREQKLREQKLREQQLREQQIREQQHREQQAAYERAERERKERERAQAAREAERQRDEERRRQIEEEQRRRDEARLRQQREQQDQSLREQERLAKEQLRRQLEEQRLLEEERRREYEQRTLEDQRRREYEQRLEQERLEERRRQLDLQQQQEEYRRHQQQQEPQYAPQYQEKPQAQHAPWRSHQTTPQQQQVYQHPHSQVYLVQPAGQPQYRQHTYSEPFITQDQHSYPVQQQQGQSAYEQHIRQLQQKEPHRAQRQFPQIGQQQSVPEYYYQPEPYEQQGYYQQPQQHYYPIQEQQYYEMPAVTQQQQQNVGGKAANGTGKAATNGTAVTIGAANGGMAATSAGSAAFLAPKPGQLVGRSAKPPVFLVHPQSVSAKVGDQLVFSAKVTGDPLPQMEWLRADGSSVPSSGRIRAEVFSDGSGRLTVEKVESEDADTYLCVARNSGGSMQSRFNLNVLQTRSPDAPQFTGRFQSTTIQEGDTIKLYCKANGEGLKFEWTKDNDKISTGGHFKVQNTATETTLIIENATLAEGGWYCCVASNQHGSTPLKGRIVVQSRKKLGPHQRELITLRKVDRRMARTPTNQMEEKPSSSAPQFQGQLQPLNLYEGQSARLEIKYAPSDDSNLKIAWLKDGKAILASSRVVTMAEFGIAVLEINPVNVFDQGEYTVVAVNPLGEARQTVNLQVMGHAQVAPRQDTAHLQQMGQSYTSASPAGKMMEMPNFHSDLRSQEIFEGHPLHLETKVTPINDPTLQAQWYLNGQPLQSGSRYRTNLDFGFACLDIDEATAQDAGTYTVVIGNEVGQSENSATILIHPSTELHAYEGNRHLDIDDVREIQYKNAQGGRAPVFLQQPQNFHCEQELGRSYFEARIQPINDPSLRVSWLKDGHPLPNANRIQTFHNFGCVSLTLHPTYPEDTGVYTCLLHNVHGTAQASAELTTYQVEGLKLDSQHDQSMNIIGYLDSHQVHIGPMPVERPEEEHSMEPPRLARQLADRMEVNENDPVHFEARIQPASDVKMQVEWLHNGHPLPAAHRFRPMFDFGYVALDILYAYPEDSGTYTLIAKNELGEIQCNLELVVNSEKTLYLDPHHPEGLERIQELEQNRIVGLEEQEERSCDNAPQFLGDLQNMQINEHDDIHLDIKVSPVNDPTMIVEWFVNGNPLLTGSRVKAMYEFGFIALDIKGAISEDSGTYTCRVRNALGEATRECTVIVMPAGTILSDTQHEESIAKINYLENLNKYGREEVEELGPEGPPQFILQLPPDIGEVEEGEPLHLECQVRPYNDNTLKITWMRDGKPIPHGHRFRTFYDFGYVSLDILGVYAQDSGVYSCLAENALGSAETATQFVCHAKEAIVGQTQHPTSYQRIQEIEAPKPQEPEAPEEAKAAPQFVKQLGPNVQANEGDSVYLEAQVIPADDNSMTYEWLLNGQPLMKAHRYVLSQDFGFIALNILYVYPEDNGTYTLIVRNNSGEAQSSMDIQCAPKGSMLTDSFHPSSVQRIQELETPQQRAEPAPDAPKQAPQIVTPLPSHLDTVHESQTLHLEAQVTPIDDNTMKYEWFFNGHPLKHSSRYRMTNDFGFCSLDIDYIIADDQGQYTLRVSNEAGQAETSTQFEVDRLKSIYTDTSHPESLRRIQEIEALQPAKPSDEEAPPEAPSFTQQLQGPTEVLKEGQSVHMDCVVQPINDPNVRIEWYHNDRPLQFGSRIRTIHDFGYVGLEFLHVHPEDTGLYTCRAVNAAGEAKTQLAIECKPKRNIYLDTQHEESWAKIQDLENKPDLREPSPEMSFPAPEFTEQLQNVDNAAEGQNVRLECRLIPINDPTLKVTWTRDGAPLPEASRFMPRRNLDYVYLDILGVSARDAGQYQCSAISQFGQAATACDVKCDDTASLMLDTQHQESWNKIQDIENRPAQEPIYEEPEKVAPKFVVPLAGNMGEFNEGVPIHLECQVEPTNDNELGVQWFHNGAPLANGHRFRTTHDFGYVALDILYAFAQDSGEWACMAKNSLGEAQTVASFNIVPRGTIYQDSQHPESWKRIQEIEAPKEAPMEIPDVEHDAPQFIEPMENLERIEFQPAHFQTRVQPFADPSMRVHWLKDGQPLHNSNRFKMTTDFGYVSLDIAHTVQEDSGVYSVLAENAKGHAQVDATLTVQGNAAILGDTQNEQSWQRIQQLEAPKEAGPEAPEIQHGPPKWVRQLNSVDNVIEGQPAHFEAQFLPFTDPNTSVQWYLNGSPLGASNRRILRNDFGLVTLDLQYVLGEDAGEYSCVVKNREGEDRTSGTLSCEARPSIYGDTQHAQSWQMIQEIEAPKAAPEEAPAPTFQKPTFTQPLQSVESPEGGVVLLEARVIPVNDPNLRIEWFYNDAPLQESNWIATNNDFGNVSLRIAPTYSRHTGVYSCRATNAEGAAVTSAQVTVQGEDSLMMDTSHPESLRKIQELEALDKYARIEAPEHEYGKPQWIQGFENLDDVQEGQVVELHGLVEPSGDPHLRIEWLLNGQPLMNANRFRQEYEFGNVILTIVHVLPHDSGVYTCRAWNAQGEASTSATVKVAGYERLLLDPQHPASWQRIQELEAPKIIEEMEEVIEKEKPFFLTQLESVTDVPEGTPVHLEATFQPARDSELQVIWEKNGHPLPASQLVQTKHELGWATLDILSVNPDHEGIYTLHIKNSEGEAASSASVKVAGTGGVLGDTRHEESWRRIQILEAPREPEPEAPAPVYDHPQITTQLPDVECEEGDHIHMEANILPFNDPNLKVQWVRNGEPLAHGSKYAISQDFGICMLDIGYTFPEDAGVYQLRIWNDQGEAVSSCTLKCTGKDAIMGDTQHAESWKRIQEIEAPKPELEEVEPAPKAAPRFVTTIQSPGDLIEGQPAHFEATIEPIDDPNMQIIWYLNGAPVTATSRVKTINDFGWAILDINHVEPRDAGEWKCVAKNGAGEADCVCSLTVQSHATIYGDSLQPQSLQRIQEIEAPRPAPEEAPAPAVEVPVITTPLELKGDLEEGRSAHLQAQYTPVNDPRLKVEWLRDGQPIHHSNRYKMVNDFGFAILEILHLMAHDNGEYTMRVFNEAGEATTSTNIQIESKSGLLLEPQNEQKAQAVEELEEKLHRRPEEIVEELKEVMPVFVEPLSAPVSCEEGDRAHFTARYEPVNDNQLQVRWYLNGNPLKTGSRVKTINDFGYVVLEISPVYPEDSGEYTCRAVNRVGEAVTSTTLTCSPKEGIISKSQLPDSMSGAQARIDEIEAPKPLAPEAEEVVHGPPKFTTALVSPPELQEGQSAHLEAQVVPIADPNLKVEWFHDGQPMRNSNRMKMVHDFGFVVLDLAPAEPQDTGKWSCRATNQYGTAECEAELKVVPTGGVFYEWQSPAERKERIEALEDWIHRPKEDLVLPPQEFDAPKFTQELTDLGTLNEADATSFVCVLEPIGDPTLRIQWLHNGHAIPYSNRIMMTNEFGVSTLLIKHIIAADAGEYQCVATNSKGEAVSTGRIEVESVTKIDAPEVVQPLVETIDNVQEGDSAHLECRVIPINDPNLKVQWLKDGHPLPEASRFKPQFEFGFASLDILYAYPEDSGDYELLVTNDKGQAVSKCHVNVLPGKSLEFAPQVHGSLQDNLESHFRQHTTVDCMLTVEDGYEESQGRKPEFKVPLKNIGVSEGEYCRFETQVAPINDPYMRLEWFKDKKPVLMGHRFRSTLDFGFAALDLLYALPDDTGEYTVVATNKFGQAMLSAKLACQGGSHVVTESQMPQGLNVVGVKKDNQNLYWSEQGPQQPRQKMAPQFTIKPRNTQATENMPARFECAVIGNPKPKVTWYINGNQALHGHRHKLNYDGLYYLTISNSRVSDAGEVVAIARNSEGEVLASCNLDVFQNDDFRQHKLKPAVHKTHDELLERERVWQKETLGKLGEHFEQAPKADAQKLMHVERARSPIEPLESEELIQKFTRPKEELYEKLSYVETQKPPFEGMKLQSVALKAGKTNKFEATKEQLPTVALKSAPVKKSEKETSPQPDWAQDGTKQLTGADENKLKRMPEQPREVVVPARDQVRLQTAKPTRAEKVDEGEHVRIEEEKAKIRQPQQGPEVPKEVVVPHKEQVSMKQQGTPSIQKSVEHVTLEEKQLKEAQVNKKPEIPEAKISNKPQPTKLGASQKAPPTVSQQLKPVQSEIGKSAKFFVAFDGALPIKVTWFKDGKELKSSFKNQIQTTNTGSTLNIGRLEQGHSGEYMVRLENVAGTVESLASLNLAAAADKGKAPDFTSKVADVRAQQNGPCEFVCQISGEPKPSINWFKDGQPLPNDGRFVPSESNGQYKLSVQTVHPQDSGVYECVAKNTAGEARCKARLNVNLVKTGKGAEEGPRLEAPRFAVQIQPIVANEGQSASFQAKFTGSPEPTIRWYRNNEPIKKVGYSVTQKDGVATLTILDPRQEDVAEYKVEASNPAGKASSVANLVLAPKSGRITRTTITRGSTGGAAPPEAAAPHFVSKLSDISARQGHTVKFSCDIGGDPQPTVQWLYNGRPLNGGRDVKITLDGVKATLELARVTFAQAGTYECVIRNPKGAAQCQAKLNLAR